MKINHFYFVFLAGVLFLPGCNDNTTNSAEPYTVSGYIYLDNQIVAGVHVDLDGKFNLTTHTDDDGYFQINDVAQGDHRLNMMKTYNDSSFTQRTLDISVNNDLFLESLKLPKGVILYPAGEITDKSVSLSWAPTDAEDFREYKLFRHSTSGLDENTGLLVHVSTSYNDTVFTDSSLAPHEKYYYRVYIMNEYGKLGGSNIVSVYTLDREIIQNGDFEIISTNNLPEAWQIWNNQKFAFCDSLECYSGKYSVHFYADSSIYMHHPFYQIIDPEVFKAGSRYRLTYWIKSKAVSSIGGFYAYIYNDDFTFGLMCNQMFGPFEEFDWTEFTFEFTYPGTISASNITLGFFTEILASTTHPIEYWLDNVAISEID